MKRNSSQSQIASPGLRRSTLDLSRDAGRLLLALGRPGAHAVVDPTEDGMIMVRCAVGGVSLGSGRFPKARFAELAGHDLAVLDGPGRMAISAAGQAHLRRAGRPADGLDVFQAQHIELASARMVVDELQQTVAVNAAESPLAWLRRRRDRGGEPLIDAASFGAGERLRRDLTQACMLPGITSRWDPSAGSGGAGPRDPASVTDMVVAARQRSRRALAAVGADLADLLIDLCGFLKGLETLERDRSWPARSAKIVVRLALARLADHYGLRPLAEGPAASRGIRTWHAFIGEADVPDASPASRTG